MPYRYLKKLIGREPDKYGDNQSYLYCQVNPKWYFDKYDVISYDYKWFVDRDTDSDIEPELPVRYVGINAFYSEATEDIKVTDIFDDDNYVGDILFYDVIIKFNDKINNQDKTNILIELIERYTNIFGDVPKIELLANKMIKNVVGKYIKIIIVKD